MGHGDSPSLELRKDGLRDFSTTTRLRVTDVPLDALVQRGVPRHRMRQVPRGVELFHRSIDLTPSCLLKSTPSAPDREPTQHQQHESVESMGSSGALGEGVLRYRTLGVLVACLLKKSRVRASTIRDWLKHMS